ncbi:uncharacterized protein EI97DRAFT_9739 [Westerdykella ornata]|uniref:Uncharacterized protein n=1 Tax=Westerdykella ornata TaxID=318751 RepID=A0A6A6JWQ0_WESOR|nr:uncharacterized protein EI97DRAFT_9739 [Westerdykella ornata]KAF2280837.1 hypothetical protein EI97DRAFT_9739 [Westerdykella ornata]
MNHSRRSGTLSLRHRRATTRMNGPGWANLENGDCYSVYKQIVSREPRNGTVTEYSQLVPASHCMRLTSRVTGIAEPRFCACHARPYGGEHPPPLSDGTRLFPPPFLRLLSIRVPSRDPRENFCRLPEGCAGRHGFDLQVAAGSMGVLRGNCQAQAERKSELARARGRA